MPTHPADPPGHLTDGWSSSGRAMSLFPQFSCTANTWSVQIARESKLNVPRPHHPTGLCAYRSAGLSYDDHLTIKNWLNDVRIVGGLRRPGERQTHSDPVPNLALIATTFVLPVDKPKAKLRHGSYRTAHLSQIAASGGAYSGLSNRLVCLKQPLIAGPIGVASNEIDEPPGHSLIGTEFSRLNVA